MAAQTSKQTFDLFGWLQNGKEEEEGETVKAWEGQSELLSPTLSNSLLKISLHLRGENCVQKAAQDPRFNSEEERRTINKARTKRESAFIGEAI